MKLAHLLLPLLLAGLLAACGSQGPAPTEAVLAPTEAVLAPTEAPLVPTEPAPSPTPTPEWVREGWDLVWQDEFDGEALDPSKWTYDIGGHGWGNNEWQFYTDRPENVRLEEGLLVIEARQEEFVRRKYTSGRIKTQGLHAWSYGRVEARMRLPYGNGIWPAFWMLGADIQENAWPRSGEIDIMEYIGREANRVYGTVHGPGYSGGGGVGHFHSLPAGTLNNEFHVFAIEWEPDEIRWYVDDTQFFKVTPQVLPGDWVYDHPFFIILNLAVGGNWPGYPDESTIFPQFLVVDHVRVYQRPGQASTSVASGPVHIGDIQTVAVEAGSEWQAQTTVTILDADGNPVEGAKVTGGWVGIVRKGETSAVTGADGTVTLLSETTGKQGEINFCVTSVSKQNTSYDKSANVRNCARVEK